MTPFHPDLENDAGHTIDQDDLIAFHLHELSPQQERALHRVLQSNRRLQSESIAIAATLHAFPKHEPALPLDAAALDRQWQTLRSSLPAHVPLTAAPRSLFRHALFTRWALPTFAAAALVGLAAFFALHHTPHTNPPTIATTTPPPPLPTVSSAIPSSNAVPSIHSVPPKVSIPSVPSHVSSLFTHPTPQTYASVPVNPSPTLPASTQPVIATSPAAVSPTTSNIATSQQPTSLSAAPTAVSRTRPTSRPHYDRTTDITLAALGNFTPARSFTSTTGTGDSAVTASYMQSTTPAVGALASFHQQFRPWLGYRITATHSEPTFEYTYQTSSGGQTSSLGNVVYEHVYEFSGTYVVQGPHHRRISTSAEAGAGVLAFRPPSSNLDSPLVSNAVRPTAVLGIAAEYALTKHLALTAAYRLLLYKAPSAYSTFGSIVPPAPNNLTLSNEPVIGLTYRFHPPRAE
jgi:hypothetical protein